jgi:hypothetical protein
VDRRLLQNVGESSEHLRFDTTIAEPDRACGQVRIWDDGSFGASTAYKQHFNTQFAWVLPPRPYCGDARCDVNESCYNVYTGGGCADCGYCPYCGDGACNGGETGSTCPSDCASPPMCDLGTCSDGSCCPPTGRCSDGRICMY